MTFLSFTLALQWSKNSVFGQSQLPKGFGRYTGKCSDAYYEGDNAAKNERETDEGQDNGTTASVYLKV